MAIERRPRQFTAVWSDDGLSVKGATIEESIFSDGLFVRNELVPITDLTPKAFKPFADAFGLKMQEARDKAIEDKQAEKDARRKEKDDAETDKVNSIKAVRALHVAELEDMRAKVDKAERKYNQLVEQLDGTEVVQRLLKEKRQAEKAREKAELQAKLKAIEEAVE